MPETTRYSAHAKPPRLPLIFAVLALLAAFVGLSPLRAQEETPAAPATPAPAAEPTPEAATNPGAPATPAEPAMAESPSPTPAATPTVEMTPAATPVPATPSEEPTGTPPPTPAGTPVVTFKPTETTPAPAPAATPAEAAETPAAATTGAAKTEEHTLDANDLATFFDGLLPALLLKDDAAGATVCVVKDGQALLTRGYGYADFKARKPVSGEETLFRPGSISKTFLAIAVMQLVEEGKLNLDRNVEEYLDFRLRARPYPGALTLRQLLTHTAGFEETLRDLFSAPGDPLMSLHDYVAQDTPPQIYPPGTVTAYSNYGMALAGYVVERVSGQPFPDYVATHIFGPLGMTHATFAQPPPEPLAAASTLGYQRAGDPEVVPFERVPAAPAGGLSASAADMGRFMLMLLNEGTLDEKRIVSPESLKALFERQHATHPALNAMGLAFYTSAENGRAIIGHGGDLIACHSEMFLLPASRVGVFFSVNSASGNKMREFVRRAFLDRYFPAPPAPTPAAATDEIKADARKAAGHYQSSRRIESSFLKITDLLNQTVINSPDDGTLTVSVSKDLRGHVIHWEPVAGQPLLYRERGGPRLIAFERNAQGQITTLHPAFPGSELQRVPWYENRYFVLPFLLPALFVILGVALLWPVAGIVRRRYARPAVEGRTSRVFFVLTRVVCVLDALAIVGWVVLLQVLEDHIWLLDGQHLRWQLPALYILGRVAVAGGLVALIGALVSLHPKFTVRPVIRWQQWLIVAACAVFALFAWHWHFLA